MALVLAERDYKLVTMFTKIIGIFTFAAGTVWIVDKGSAVVGLLLVLAGIVVTLAPVPMTVVQPDSYAEADDDLVTIDEV